MVFPASVLQFQSWAGCEEYPQCACFSVDPFCRKGFGKDLRRLGKRCQRDAASPLWCCGEWLDGVTPGNKCFSQQCDNQSLLWHRDTSWAPPRSFIWAVSQSSTPRQEKKGRFFLDFLNPVHMLLCMSTTCWLWDFRALNFYGLEQQKGQNSLGPREPREKDENLLFKIYFPLGKKETKDTEWMFQWEKSQYHRGASSVLCADSI